MANNFAISYWHAAIEKTAGLEPGQPGFLKDFADLHLASGGSPADIPAYWHLSARLEQEGFKGSPFMDPLAENPLESAVLIAWEQPSTGALCIQRGFSTGESELFYLNAATDLPSQLAALAEFTHPSEPGELASGEPTSCE